MDPDPNYITIEETTETMRDEKEKNHQKGRGKFECSDCSAVCNSQRELYIHKQFNHKEVKYCCGQCD